MRSDDNAKYLRGIQRAVGPRTAISLRDPLIARTMHQAVSDQLTFLREDDDISDAWLGL